MTSAVIQLTDTQTRKRDQLQNLSNFIGGGKKQLTSHFDNSTPKTDQYLHEDFANNNIIIIFENCTKNNSDPITFCLHVPKSKHVSLQM